MTTTCTRCRTTITLASSGEFVTGDGNGWILPWHLNNTCDGIHLHRPASAPA